MEPKEEGPLCYCVVRLEIQKEPVKTKEIPHLDCGKNTTVLNAKQLTTTFN